MKLFKQFLFTGLIISTAMKYGPNGYISSSANSFYSGCTSTAKNKGTCSTSQTSGATLTDRIVPVWGVSLQTVPDRFGLSLGLGYYFDQTATLSLGIRL